MLSCRFCAIKSFISLLNSMDWVLVKGSFFYHEKHARHRFNHEKHEKHEKHAGLRFNHEKARKARTLRPLCDCFLLDIDLTTKSTKILRVYPKNRSDDNAQARKFCAAKESAYIYRCVSMYFSVVYLCKSVAPARGAAGGSVKFVFYPSLKIQSAKT